MAKQRYILVKLGRTIIAWAEVPPSSEGPLCTILNDPKMKLEMQYVIRKAILKAIKGDHVVEESFDLP